MPIEGVRVTMLDLGEALNFHVLFPYTILYHARNVDLAYTHRMFGKV